MMKSAETKTTTSLMFPNNSNEKRTRAAGFGGSANNTMITSNKNNNGGSRFNRKRKLFRNKNSSRLKLFISFGCVGLMLLYIEIILLQQVRNSAKLQSGSLFFHDNNDDDRKANSHHHHSHHSHHHRHGGLPGVLVSSAADLYQNSNNKTDSGLSSKFLSCNDLFSDDNFQIITK